MRYIKQLDVVRAVAVIFVMIAHWIPERNIIQRFTGGTLGGIGVDVFFVLSGFLISSILFESRNSSEISERPKSQLLKNFYVRRSLRIFPIYYITIFLLLFFEKHIDVDVSSGFAYYATYTTNFYFFKINGWVSIFSHLWSLAVEEQFYLIWPWIVLFINKKYLKAVIIGFIGIGIITQLFMGNIMQSILPYTCFDAFGLGALLSWYMAYKPQAIEKMFRYLSVAAVVSFMIVMLDIFKQELGYPLFRTAVSCIGLWFIAYIVINQNSEKINRNLILNNRGLIFIGKISYGIYLYHNIIPSVVNSKIVNVYINPLLPGTIYKDHWGALFLVENVLLVLMISWISYAVIEKFFLNLKKYFI